MGTGTVTQEWYYQYRLAEGPLLATPFPGGRSTAYGLDYSKVDLGLRAWWRQTIQPGWCVVDVGANVGLYTVLAAGTADHVWAFEPHPYGRALLSESVALNGFDNVTVLPHALAQDAGERLWYASADPSCRFSGFKRPRAGRGSWVKTPIYVRPLDDWANTFRKVDLLKVDANGCEGDVLRGATEVIRLYRPIIVCKFSDVSAQGDTETARDMLELLPGYVWRNLDGSIHVPRRSYSPPLDLVGYPS